MKKFFAISLLAMTAVAGAQTTPAQQPSSSTAGQTSAQAGQQPAQQPGQQQQIVIKDPAEYQAYTSAVGQSDPAQKATALEAFLQQYPSTVVKKEALEALLASYQQSQNMAKLTDTAQKLLQVDPTSEQALLVLAFSKRQQADQAAATQAGNPQAVTQAYQDAAQYAQQALQNIDRLQKPANLSDEQFAQQKQQIAALMNSTIGLSAYQANNYQQAIPALQTAVKDNPKDFLSMFYLGNALAKPVTRQLMFQNPQNAQQLLEGVFWLTKSATEATTPQAKQQFTSVAQYYYTRYHGSADGFDQATQQVAAMPAFSAQFQVTPAPSPQQQAATVLAQTPPDQILAQDGFPTWESILTIAAPADAQKVWDATKGKRLDLSGTVVAATNSQIQLAVSDDAVAANRADVTVNLAKPVTTPPAVGTQNYEVLGNADSYVSQPAFMLTLAEGAPKEAPKAKAPVRRAPTHRRTTPKAQ